MRFPLRATAGKLLGVASVVYVNGKRSYRRATVRLGDAVRTGGLSEAVFVADNEVFMLRQNSEMRLLAPRGGSNRLAAGLRLITSGLLPVIAAGERKVQTATGTAAIRGTACYVEVRPEKTWFCTCYGKVNLSDSAGDATLPVSAEHHHANSVHANAQAGDAIEHSTMQNHYDADLMLLIALVGTKPPFAHG